MKSTTLNIIKMKTEIFKNKNKNKFKIPRVKDVKNRFKDPNTNIEFVRAFGL